MGKTPDKNCDRCGTPTSAISGRCAKCKQKGELCAVCKTNWTGQSKFMTCSDCRQKAMVDRLVAEGELERCPDCGGPMKAGRDKCWKCWTKERPEICPKCGWRLKAGEACPREHRKPWETPEWKARRKEVIARTKNCEWCQDPFAPPKNPPVVTRITKPPRTGDVKADQEAYKAINDLEVRVVCKTCAAVWRKYRIRGRKDPMVVCPKCQGMKQPRYLTCYECSGKKEEVEKRHRAESLWSALDELANWRGCPKGCPEPSVMYLTLEDGVVGGQGISHRCAIKALEKEFPGMIREATEADEKAIDEEDYHDSPGVLPKNLAPEAWLWCLSCERFFQAKDLRIDFMGNRQGCAFEDCGAAGWKMKIFPWDEWNSDGDLAHWPKSDAELKKGQECPLYPEQAGKE